MESKYISIKRTELEKLLKELIRLRKQLGAIELLLQHDMKRTIAVSDDPSSSAVLYDVAAVARVHSDNSHIKDLSRTKDSYRDEDAGQHSQDEDQSRPENKRTGLRKGIEE